MDSAKQSDRPKSLSRFAGMALLAACLAPHIARADTMQLPPSPAVSCLTVRGEQGRPKYPGDALLHRIGGVVRVQLAFEAPDGRPDVKFLKRSGNDELDDAVENFVTRYRVPCMRANGAPVLLTQEYTFDPDGRGRVVNAETTDSADELRAEQLKCITHTERMSKPAWPKIALRNEYMGNVIISMRFTARDAPPELTFHTQAEHQSLRTAVAEYAAGMRMPCLRDAPVHTYIKFAFTLDGHPGEIGLPDLGLLALLRGAKDLETPVAFDTSKMACPFDLRLTYRRPFLPNKVEQLDSDVGARAPFLQWLRGLQLNVDAGRASMLFGQTLIVSVPCVKFEL